MDERFRRKLFLCQRKPFYRCRESLAPFTSGIVKFPAWIFRSRNGEHSGRYEEWGRFLRTALRLRHRSTRHGRPTVPVSGCAGYRFDRRLRAFMGEAVQFPDLPIFISGIVWAAAAIRSAVGLQSEIPNLPERPDCGGSGTTRTFTLRCVSSSPFSISWFPVCEF